MRTGQDLETSFNKKETTSELLIAGYLYISDFENMFQVNNGSLVAVTVNERKKWKPSRKSSLLKLSITFLL